MGEIKNILLTADNGTGWTCSTGNTRYTLLQDGSDSTYIYSQNTAASQNLVIDKVFTFNQTSIVSFNIKTRYAKTVGSASPQVQPRVRLNNANTYNGTNHTATTSIQESTDVWLTNPATLSAWTPTELNESDATYGISLVVVRSNNMASGDELRVYESSYWADYKPLLVVPKLTHSQTMTGNLNTIRGWILSDIGKLTHANSLQARVLSQKHTLSVGKLTHANSLTSFAVIQHYTLTGAGKLSHTQSIGTTRADIQVTASKITHTQTFSVNALTQEHTLNVNSLIQFNYLQTANDQIEVDVDSLSHSQTIGNVELIMIIPLEVNSMTQGQTTQDVGELTPVLFAYAYRMNHDHTLSNIDIIENKNVVSDKLTHSQTLQSKTLTQKNILTVSKLRHSQTLQSKTLTQKQKLTISKATQAHKISSIAIVQAQRIRQRRLAQAQTLTGALILPQKNKLTVANLRHYQRFPNLLPLRQKNRLVVSSMRSVNNLQSPLPVMRIVITSVGKLNHSQSLQARNISQKNSLTIGNINQSQTLQTRNISQKNSLNVGELTHENSLNSILLHQYNTLSSHNMKHGNTLNTINIEQKHNITVLSFSQFQSLNDIGIEQKHIVYPADLHHNNFPDGFIDLIRGIIVPNDDISMSQSQTISTDLIYQKHLLTVDDLSHDNTMNSDYITQKHDLISDNLYQNTFADYISNISIMERGDSLIHDHILPNLDITQKHMLFDIGLSHEHSLDSAKISYIYSTIHTKLSFLKPYIKINVMAER